MERRVSDLVAVLRHRVGGDPLPDGLAGDAVLPTTPALPERIAVVTHGIMSRVILKLLLDLDPAQAVTLRHPNALFYRLEFTPTRIRHSYFLEGEGPFEGLLRH
jgi:broad specificity phosphatase PhoE